jgi:hypothetical protein
MWNYGVFGKQRDERLCGKEHLYICEEASESTSSTNVARLAFAAVCISGGTEAVQANLPRKVKSFYWCDVATNQGANR